MVRLQRFHQSLVVDLLSGPVLKQTDLLLNSIPIFFSGLAVVVKDFIIEDGKCEECYAQTNQSQEKCNPQIPTQL